MKKKSFKTLNLGKQTLSKVTYNKVVGGETNNFSCDPNPSSYPLNCEPLPSEVSLCTITKFSNCPVSKY